MAAKRGCFKRGGFPIWTCPSFFVLFCPFGTFPGIFPICAGMVRGFSRLFLFLFLSLLRAPTRNSPERVRDTIWTIPKKSGKHPGLETPRFSFSQTLEICLERPFTPDHCELLRCMNYCTNYCDRKQLLQQHPLPSNLLRQFFGNNLAKQKNKGEAFLLTVRAFFLTVKLLCLQSLKALIRRTFPL